MSNPTASKQLGELLSLEYGSALPEQVRSGYGYPVFGSNGIVGRHAGYLVNGPGIVVGRKGSVGEVCWSDESFWPIDTTYYVKARDGVHLRWLYWALKHSRINELDAATGVPGLNRNDAYQLAVFAPDADEQSSIAAILDTLDIAIEKSKTLIAKLRQVRAGLLRDLLTCGLDEQGQLRDPVVHPELFQETQVGRIPLGWQVTRLGRVAQFVTSGSRGWASHYSDQGALFLRIGNLTREHINLRLEDVVRVQPPAGTEGARTKIQPGDVLISITADLGIVGVIPEPFEEAYVNQHIALVRPVPTVCSKWIGRYLAFGPGAVQFRMLNDAGAKAGMTLPAVESLVIALPSSEEQTQISAVLDAVDAEISGQARTFSKFREIKSGLMDDLLTGRVRVPVGLELA